MLQKADLPLSLADCDYISVADKWAMFQSNNRSIRQVSGAVATDGPDGDPAMDNFDDGELHPSN